MTIMTIIYYAGIASCGIQGAEKYDKNMQNSRLNLLVCAFLSAFAGGLIRDIFILNVFPVAFTIKCIPDIMMALLAAILYVRIKNKKLIQWFSFFSDAMGLSQFIVIGVDKSSIVYTNNIINILSGVITSLGGGIVSSLFCHESLKKTFSKNISYRLLAIGGTIIYICLINNGIEPLIAQTTLVSYTFITISSCNKKIRKIIKNYIKKTMCNLPYIMNIYTPTVLIKYSRQYTNKPIFIMPINISINTLRFNYHPNRGMVFRFHRIRQM